MAYCTWQQVANISHLPIAPESTPSADEVDGFCDDIAGEIDGVLEAKGYTLPVTNAGALSLLRMYNEFGAATKTWHAMFQAQDAPANVEYWERSYTAFLGRLRRGEQLLPGEEAGSDVADLSLYYAAPRAE